MKQLLSILTMLLVFLFSACTKKQETAQQAAAADTVYHIGVVTGTVSQSEDDLRGAERLIKEYGDEAQGGMIKHINYPDNFMSEMETTISQIAGLADDPKMKAIVVNQAIPGTTEAFKKVREKRPDILLFAGEPHEDPLVIEQAADLAINSDFVSRGYLIVWSAQQLGAKTFVHISFPRHMSYETLGRRKAIMEAACKDLGIKFVFETAPDPTSDVGTAGAQQFILEKTPAWVKKYGKETAFFCTNDAHTEPLLKQLMKHGGFFVEADLPSPLLGYPGALGIDLSKEQGDFPAILKKVEKAVVDGGGAGRFGTWAYSYGYTTTAGLGELAKNIIDKKVTLKQVQDGDMKPLMDAYNKYTPGASWNGAFYVDATTGKKAVNHVLIYQDTYMMGKGYMNTTTQTIPEKYLTITK